MNHQYQSKKNELLKLALIFIGTIIIGGVFFVINILTGIFSSFITIIQLFFSLLFSIWYIRLFLIYLKEIRKKNQETKIGVPLGWSIFGLIITILNFIVWALLSNLIFNFPKIVFLIPVILALIQVIYVLKNSNRVKLREWLILIYNIFSLLHLLVWTIIDFGADLPSVLGIFGHTLTSNVMWWQLFFFNTGAFFSPVFIFPPYMLNPRYYFAMKVEDYLQKKEEERVTLMKKTSTIEKDNASDNENQERVPGERVPFFEERQKQKEIEEEISALKKLRERNIMRDDDDQYAEFVGSSDVSFSVRKYIQRYDNFLRLLIQSIILVLIVLTPFTLAGNISLNIPPKYTNYEFNEKTDMVLAIQGSVFSSTDYFGNLTIDWSEDLDKEIALSKELQATHIRYDIKSRLLYNNASKELLDEGIARIKSEGLKLILCVDGDISFTKNELVNVLYQDSIIIAQDYQPDYMIIFNELNGELLNNINEGVTIESWLEDIGNISSTIKSESSATKTVTTILANNLGLEYFPYLFNSTLNLDVLGVSYFPFLFNWRYQLLEQFSTIFQQENSSQKFWISETGMETLNYGEEAQERFLTKLLYDASEESLLNADGVVIKSLIDNEGVSVERGITSHFGLTYFNGRKKAAFNAIREIFSQILGF